MANLEIDASNEHVQNGLTVIDLFAGPGGLSLGFTWAGFVITLAVESNSNAAETYRNNHHKTILLESDASEIKPNEIDALCGKPDVIIGGPPCRGFSAANTQSRGLDHPGTTSSWHFVRLVEQLLPRAFVMENVPGFIHLSGGSIFSEFKRRFTESGYYVKKLHLNSSNFGVPQRRERIFIIGAMSECKIKPERVSRSITVGEAMSDLPSIPEGGGGAQEMHYENGPVNQYQKWTRGKSKALYNHITTKSRDYMVERFRHVSQGGNWRDIPQELMSNYSDTSKMHSIIYKRLSWDDQAPTVTNIRKSVVIHPFENRLLSIREAARLQSLPDSYRFHGPLVSMQQQVADLVPPLMAKAVADSLYKLLRDN